ncbi:pre-mRNA-splicing factor CLF1 [Laetiporus sulphureus 93-53]|uniref:Pre-mRNA-splicing factor CLF1 n=1 Tax=Laetiporus sulphureus 93-53 TaxID=1314785 RepID=A0A165DFR9_9APHY|nr:pre-mRNA-splicing factor CLF1 [Laetiporus sulphureus 93-53]KZT04795.1 pre-mRNA-splicing factor CLF1 [Laetiporus sulphureus 93-53]
MQDERAPRIKNRARAAVQVTAEQLLRDAQEHHESQIRPPQQRVENFEELHEYRCRKREEFEKRIRQTRGNMKEWLQYGNWEASQNEFSRARSLFERALDVDPRNVKLWLTYTDIELKSRNVQHARNLFDRAVTLLPRVDQLWYRYVYLEELLQNIPGARQVFDRWMQWQPDDKAWQAYISFEQRYEEHDRASAIYERWVAVRPKPRVWVKWGKFEEERGNLTKARKVFQTAVEYFGDEEGQLEKTQALFNSFANMETRQREYKRARIIYKLALSYLPRSKSNALYAAYTQFEKQHGTRATLEAIVLGKRRIQYEEELSHDGRNYDVWVDYIRLEEGALQDLPEENATAEEIEQACGRVREVYERAIAQTPPGNEKQYWRHYIYLWLNYALFEEIETKDYARAREIYQTALKLVPHKQFTFAKLWILFARFEVRRMDLGAARKILGTAIGMCPKEALFKGYIKLEIDLREFDRARTLYEKYIEYDPTNSSAWINFAELESQLGDYARARAIFELGISQSTVPMPELIWKKYIDLEVEGGERERARALYERLVALSGHVKVWLSYALFEAQPMPAPREEDEEGETEAEMVEGDVDLARRVFDRGYKDLKSKGLKQDQLALLLVWRTFEEERGTPADVAKVEAIMPVPYATWRFDEEAGQFMDVDDMLFKGGEYQSSPTLVKFLQAARAWKNAKSESSDGLQPPKPEHAAEAGDPSDVA